MLALSKEQVEEAAVNNLVRDINQNLIDGISELSWVYSRGMWVIVGRAADKFTEKKWVVSTSLVNDNVIKLTLE